MQALAILRGDFFNHRQFRLAHRFRSQKPRYQHWPFEQAQPALQHFGSAPLLRPFPIDMHHHMKMIAHHRIRGDIQRKNISKLQDTLPYPAAPVLKVFAGKRILPT